MKVIQETRESRKHETPRADLTPAQIEFARRMAEESARRKAIREGAARRRARQAALAAKEACVSEPAIVPEESVAQAPAVPELLGILEAEQEPSSQVGSLDEVLQSEEGPSEEDLTDTEVLSQDQVCEAVAEGQILSRVERRRRERAVQRETHAAYDMSFLHSDDTGFSTSSLEDSVPTAPSAEDVSESAQHTAAAMPNSAKQNVRKPVQMGRGSSRPGAHSGKTSGRKPAVKPATGKSHAKKSSPKKNLLQGMTVSALAVGGVAVPLLGMGNIGGGAAQAAQGAASLSASIVGGTAVESTTPTALAGSSTAVIRSEVSTVSEQADSDSAPTQCSPEGAQGIRAAFTYQSSSAVVFPLDAGVYTRTSDFGPRIDPIYGDSSFHAGQDYAAPSDTPIYAIADGTVTFAGGSTAGRSPNTIVIKHEIDGKTYESWYVHMWDHGVLVKEGDKVTAGQQIGLVGSNGNSTGPHLHLEIHDPSLGTAEEVSTLLDPDDFLTEHGAIDIKKLCE